MNRHDHRIYRLDGFEIDEAQACLKRNGNEEHLRYKSFQVLLYLLEHPQRLITKSELIERVWPDAAVTDNALEQSLAEIRKVLGDDSRHPRFIKTVPRRGYCFIGSIEEVSLNSDAIETNEVAAASPGEPVARLVEPVEPSIGGARKISRRALLIIIPIILTAATAIALYSIQKRRS